MTPVESHDASSTLQVASINRLSAAELLVHTPRQCVHHMGIDHELGMCI